jgi:SOS-response transcriptional repressor LexA
MSKLLAKNIEFLMQKHEIKNPNDLAKRTKIPQPTLFRWMVGAAREPRQSSLKPLAEFFGIAVSDLMERDIETGEIKTEVANYKLRSEVHVLPMEMIKKYPEDLNSGEYVPFLDEVPVMEAKVSRNAFAIIVKGDAMAPLMPEGARLIVDPFRPAVHGDFIVVAEPSTHFPIIRKMVEEGGYTYLQPENSKYDTIKLDVEPQIFGVIAEMQIIKVF